MTSPPNHKPGERMWCRLCGSITLDGQCHCTEIGDEPDLVNYGDAGWAAAREADQRAAGLEEALRALRKFVDVWNDDLAREITAKIDRALGAEGEGK